MAHLDRDFPRNIAQGCQAVAQRRDEIVTLASGREEINQRWQHARRSWLAGLAIRSADDMSDVLDLWEESQGRRHSFRFRDWLDYKSCRPSEQPGPTDQAIGIGTGAQSSFQISKTYGIGLPYVRPIYLPRPGSVRVAVNGVEELSGWTVSPTGGTLTFDTPPGASLSVTVGFEFDVPVRFEADSILAEWTYFQPGGDGVASAPDVSLIEVILSI